MQIFVYNFSCKIYIDSAVMCSEMFEREIILCPPCGRKRPSACQARYLERLAAVAELRLMDWGWNPRRKARRMQSKRTKCQHGWTEQITPACLHIHLFRFSGNSRACLSCNIEEGRAERQKGKGVKILEADFGRLANPSRSFQEKRDVAL